MLPPVPYSQVDLLNVARQQFKFPSNKLDYVAQALGLGSKTSHTGFDLWVRCMAGEDKAWSLMRKYNKQDVVLTEKLYDKLLPWIKSHPSVPLHDGNRNDACTNCGSEDLKRDGYAMTNVGKYQRYQCRDCGKYLRSGKRIDGVDVRGM